MRSAGAAVLLWLTLAFSNSAGENVALEHSCKAGMETGCLNCARTCRNPAGPKLCNKLCAKSCICSGDKILDEVTWECVDKAKECSEQNLCPDGSLRKCITYDRLCRAFGGHAEVVSGCLRVGCACPEGTMYDSLQDTCVELLEQCTDIECPSPLMYRKGKTCNACDKGCTKEERKAEAKSYGCFCPRDTPVLVVKDGIITCRKGRKACKSNEGTKST